VLNYSESCVTNYTLKQTRTSEEKSTILGNLFVHSHSYPYNCRRAQIPVICGVILYYILIGTLFTGKKNVKLKHGLKFSI